MIEWLTLKVMRTLSAFAGENLTLNGKRLNSLVLHSLFDHDGIFLCIGQTGSVSHVENDLPPWWQSG